MAFKNVSLVAFATSVSPGRGIFYFRGLFFARQKGCVGDSYLTPPAKANACDCVWKNHFCYAKLKAEHRRVGS